MTSRSVDEWTQRRPWTSREPGGGSVPPPWVGLLSPCPGPRARVGHGVWEPRVCGPCGCSGSVSQGGTAQLDPRCLRGGVRSAVRYVSRPLASVPFWPQLKRSRETEVQLKPLVEKSKRMHKKNEDLLQSIQRMEEKIKALTRDNVELVGARPPCRPQASLSLPGPRVGSHGAGASGRGRAPGSPATSRPHASGCASFSLPLSFFIRKMGMKMSVLRGCGGDGTTAGGLAGNAAPWGGSA